MCVCVCPVTHVYTHCSVSLTFEQREKAHAYAHLIEKPLTTMDSQVLDIAHGAMALFLSKERTHRRIYDGT